MKPRTTLWILLAFAAAGVGIGEANRVDANTKSNAPSLATVDLDSTETAYRHHGDYPIEIGAALRF